MNDISRLHKWGHDDYNVAKTQIHQQLGDITDMAIWGRQVLCAVYVRPIINEKNGWIQTTVAQKEDIYQGKVVMLLMAGPDAFKGDEGYVDAVFGPSGPPVPGDWLFTTPSSGVAISLAGEGGQQVLGKDIKGDDMPLYGWNGWPCRIIPDTEFLGRILKPHSVI